MQVVSQKEKAMKNGMILVEELQDGVNTFA